MNRNSALLWLPKIIEASLPTPKTEIVEYDHHHMMILFEDRDPQFKGEYEKFLQEIGSACDKLGYPCFLRTDLSSAKHDGPEAYKVSKESEIPQRVSFIIQDNEMKFWLEKEGPKAFLVREWLNLETAFSAFQSHAIAREWRFFANAEKVICFHPYWPESAIKFYDDPEPENWKERLAEFHAVPQNIEELKKMAIKAASVYGITASIDFAKDVSGKWWLTDMAAAEDSYHWKECENANIQVIRSYLPDVVENLKEGSEE